MADVKPPPCLSDEVNAATRSLHTTLNRLITTRLPLALPPLASDPTLYTTGMHHFSYIFLTFESLWADIVAPPSSAETSSPTSPLLSFLLVNPYDNPERFSTVSPPSPEMLGFLQRLRPAGLARSTRVKQDLEFLTGLGETDISVLLSQYPGEQVKAFAEHIRDAVRAKPHVLVAYAWCFYMAVFSGGRWIRAQLVEAGDEFWTAGKSDADVPLSDRGLSFWNFEGTEDGEDIKAEFRARLAEGEVLFSKEQREDVVQEAKEIFGLCESVVVELDEKLGTDMSAVDSIHRSQKGSAPKRADDTTGAGGKAAETPLMWLRRPEVTGAVVALGCLAYVALAKLDVGLW